MIEEEEALNLKYVLNAKIEGSIKAIEPANKRRQSYKEERSTIRMPPGSNNYNGDSCLLQLATDEQRKRTSELSEAEQHQSGNKQTTKTSGQSVSDNDRSRPIKSNNKSDLDLNVLQESNPLKAADVRRRRKSANDEPSAEEKRHARKLIAQNGRRRASIADGRVQKSSNYRVLASERDETRPRLTKGDSKRSLACDYSNLPRKESTESEQRSGSKKRLSSGNDSGWNSGGSKERLQTSISRIERNSTGLQNPSTKLGARVQRSLSRRKLSIENGESSLIKQPSLQSSLDQRKDASAQSFSQAQNATSRGREFARSSSLRSVGSFQGGASKVQSTTSRRRELDRSSSLRSVGSQRGSANSSSRRRELARSSSLRLIGSARDSVSKTQNPASRRRELARSSSLLLVANSNETLGRSPSGTNNFTWTWRKGDMEPTLRKSTQSSVPSNVSPPAIKRGMSSRTASVSSTPPSATKRASKRSDSLLSPGARRNSRAKEHLGSPLSSNLNLPLGNPDSKNKSSFTKARGASLRRQASKSKAIGLEALNASDSQIIVDDLVNKKDIGAIAQVLKESNQAEEDLERQKEQERQAKRSHIRARRQQTSTEMAT